jgi:hypothetical protein
MTISELCICLHDEPQGIRPGPNAPIRPEANPKCWFCQGTGRLLITVVYERPPVQLPNCEWSAIVDGCEEVGPVGYGGTKVAALANLMRKLEEEVA